MATRNPFERSRPHAKRQHAAPTEEWYAFFPKPSTDLSGAGAAPDDGGRERSRRSECRAVPSAIAPPLEKRRGRWSRALARSRTTDLERRGHLRRGAAASAISEIPGARPPAGERTRKEEEDGDGR
ncbi:hypothetical protein NL676_024718 [Syzygium grande]|nr:hypothetical protein NL676_024718 [Syzygium grande]